MAPATRAMTVFTYVPDAPTTTLTAVAAPRKAPGMNESGGIFDCNTIAKATTPTSADRIGTPPPSLLETKRATNAQKTPERFEASVLVSPAVLPPAAKNVPQATMPAQTGSAATPSAMYVHTAIR